jgi:hypothetical protein
LGGAGPSIVTVPVVGVPARTLSGERVNDTSRLGRISNLTEAPLSWYENGVPLVGLTLSFNSYSAAGKLVKVTEENEEELNHPEPHGCKAYAHAFCIVVGWLPRPMLPPPGSVALDE